MAIEDVCGLRIGNISPGSVSHVVDLRCSAMICDVLILVYELSVPQGTFLCRWNQISYVSKFGGLWAGSNERNLLMLLVKYSVT
jgi:hypothetical protein